MGKQAAGQARLVIGAPIENVYDVISDVTRTGEWSPECVRVEWIEEGKRFVGHNRDGSREWSMECVVDEATRPTAFAFHTERNGEPRTKWGYRLASVDGGTEVVEWYQRVGATPVVARVLERFVMGGRKKHNAQNMAASLERLKRVVEGD